MRSILGGITRAVAQDLSVWGEVLGLATVSGYGSDHRMHG